MTISAFPTPIPARGQTEDVFDPAMAAFLAQLPTFVAEANAVAVAMNLNSTTDTSTSSVAIAIGTATFAVTSGKSWQPGMFVVAARTSAPSTSFMYGQVTSYSGTTLVIDVAVIGGSGTFAAWTISQSSGGINVNGSLNEDFDALNMRLAGTLGIGATTLASHTAILHAATVALSGATGQYSMRLLPTFGSDATTGYGVFSAPSTTAAAYTMSAIRLFAAGGFTLGAGSVVSTYAGFYSVDESKAATNYAYYGAMAAGSGKWGGYHVGTATHFFNANVLIGSGVDDGINRLQVTGDSTITGYEKNTNKVVTTTAGLTSATISTSYRYFTGAAGASFALTLPAGVAAIDGVLITIMSTVDRPSTSWTSTGATFVGTPAALVANVPVKLQYHHATLLWLITS